MNCIAYTVGLKKHLLLGSSFLQCVFSQVTTKQIHSYLALAVNLHTQEGMVYHCRIAPAVLGYNPCYSSPVGRSTVHNVVDNNSTTLLNIDTCPWIENQRMMDNHTDVKRMTMMNNHMQGCFFHSPMMAYYVHCGMNEHIQDQALYTSLP